MKIEFLTTGSFPHDNLSSVYWIFTKLGHMIALWKGKNPIYFGVITVIPFDNLYRCCTHFTSCVNFIDGWILLACSKNSSSSLSPCVIIYLNKQYTSDRHQFFYHSKIYYFFYIKFYRIN
jgi:hypothetical protein